MPFVRVGPVASPGVRRFFALVTSLAVLLMALDRAVALPLPDLDTGLEPLAGSGHLVVSEVATGGVSASDEFIEIYNPTAAALPLEGLEVVYVTATGATITRKASWAAGAAVVPPGAHVLVANEAGIFAVLADATYANGLSATGGSVALRIQGAASAIDAVGWGTAASSWLETRPAPAPAAGSSLERLPGGSNGSTLDTDDNLVDFTVQPLPDPQNSMSEAVPVPVPSATPSPTPSPTPSDTVSPAPTPSGDPTPSQTATVTQPPTPTDTPLATATLSAPPTPSAIPTATPTPTPTPSPTPAPITIEAARALPDGAQVTVEGVALTDSSFTEGGGYLADATGGVAVLVSDGSFDRGVQLRVTGFVDDRYAQRTIRSTAAGIQLVGMGTDPQPVAATTGAIGEAMEGTLVELSGVIASGLTQLSGATAVELDDGSGAARVVIVDAAGIDPTGWVPGTSVRLVGVVGQRDSSGTGLSGYRVHPRDSADLLAFGPTPTPAPTATPVATATPTPAPTATPDALCPLVSIADARSAPTGTRLRIRGVVTLPSGLVDPASAAVQDATGAILIRLGDDAGPLELGVLVELEGTRSTKAGMLSLRVTRPPLALGSQGDPEPIRRATGALGEPDEAQLVLTRGLVATAVTRSSAGSVSFALDDGSGPIRVHLPAGVGISATPIVRGAWVEVRGVLGQETTGREPERGYRIWPRQASDLEVVAVPPASTAGEEARTTTQPAGVEATVAASPAASPRAPGSRFDALEGGSGAVDAWTERTVVRPVLARAMTTVPPPPVITDVAPAPSGARAVLRPAGLAASGFGAALLAGGIALIGRRARRSRPAASRAYTPADSMGHARSRELPPP